MGDDVVEHLSTVDEFEHHVVVICVSDEFAHAADVRVVEQEGDCGFADGADFFGFVFLAEFGEFFGGEGGVAMGFGVTGDDFDGALRDTRASASV